jgi:hypothetical protein
MSIYRPPCLFRFTKHSLTVLFSLSLSLALALSLSLVVCCWAYKFADMDGVDFIYKERPGSRLADMIERLKVQYGRHFGEDKVQILGGRYDESKVDRSKFLYLRIVAVEPYLDDEELIQRQSPFEKRFNLNRFIFETPFTTTGKVHSDDIREQQKKKTILTTELPFPYVIKRLRVDKRVEISLSPIEVCIASQ